MRAWVPILVSFLSSVALAAKSYPVDGIVVALDPAARTMLVSHRPIGRYMGAMVMPFRVQTAGDLDGLYPGARVQFDLLVGKDRSLARNVRKSGGADAEGLFALNGNPRSPKNCEIFSSGSFRYSAPVAMMTVRASIWAPSSVSMTYCLVLHRRRVAAFVIIR